MKKILTIFVSLIFVLSGLHFSISSHFCQGQWVAAKASFMAETAGCGMEDMHTPEGIFFIEGQCCTDHISFLDTENEYTGSAIHVPVPEYRILEILLIPNHQLFKGVHLGYQQDKNIRPPGRYSLPNEVDQSRICVLLI